MIWRGAVFTFLILGLYGCDDSIESLSGRYFGIRTSGSSREQVMAHIGLKSQSSFEVKLFQILGNAEAQRFLVSAKSEEEFEIRSPLFGSSAVTLLRKDNCLNSTVSKPSVNLCWSNKKVSLNLKLNESSEKVFINLTQSDELPLVDDRVGTGKTYNLNELLGRARFSSYSSDIEAEKVYQAKERVKALRAALLPGINAQAVIGIATGGYISTIGTVLPFLFPDNWYRIKVAQELLSAQKASYVSVVGNQMNAVEELYYLIYRDKAVLNYLNQHINWLVTIQQGLKVEESAGGLPTGTSDFFGITIGNLEKDRVKLEALISDELVEISKAVALSPLNGVSDLAVLSLPLLDNVPELKPETFFRDAQLKSFEAKALSALVRASQYQEGEILFGFLNPNSSDSLSFATPRWLNINKSSQRVIQKQLEEAYALIEAKSKMVATEYNSSIENYLVAKTNLERAQRKMNWLINRHLNGDHTMDENEFVDNLTQYQLQILSLSADKITYTLGWLMAKAKLERLLLSGVYSNIDQTPLLRE